MVTVWPVAAPSTAHCMSTVPDTRAPGLGKMQVSLPSCGVLLASAVPPYRPMFSRRPLGSGSDTQAVECREPASISGEALVSLVTHPVPG